MRKQMIWSYSLTQYRLHVLGRFQQIHVGSEFAMLRLYCLDLCLLKRNGWVQEHNPDYAPAFHGVANAFEDSTVYLGGLFPPRTLLQQVPHFITPSYIHSWALTLQNEHPNANTLLSRWDWELAFLEFLMFNTKCQHNSLSLLRDDIKWPFKDATACDL